MFWLYANDFITGLGPRWDTEEHVAMLAQRYTEIIYFKAELVMEGN